ncbi:peptidoglycan DD-metalloendopeptidase family protein, partial [bacterium]|nr:peptidoglycan DD-metalloendopeptidase family protein [bacterium]
KQYLFYDGHPGFDYRASSGTLIYAPADGTVSIPSTDSVNGSPTTWNTIKIDHLNGYSTWYLHCSSHVITSCSVKRGEAFAKVGDKGCEGSTHLHFEVRKDEIPVDPYGWEGGSPDPYNRATSINLWKSLCPTAPTNKSLARIEGQSSVYWLQNGKAYHIVSMNIINDMSGLPGWDHICNYSSDKLEIRPPGTLPVEGTFEQGPDFIAAGVDSEGLLVKSSTDSRVYIIKDGQRRWITSETIFNELGYDWNDVLLVTDNILNNIPEGEPISSSNLSLERLQELFSFDWDIFDRESIYSIIRNCLNDPDYTYWIFNPLPTQVITSQTTRWIRENHSSEDSPIGKIAGQELITSWLDASWGNGISTDDSFNTVYKGYPEANENFEVISFIDQLAPFCGSDNQKSYFFSYDTKNDENGDAVSFNQWIDYLKAIKNAYGRPIDTLTIFSHGDVAEVMMSEAFHLKSDIETKIGMERLRRENILSSNATILLFSCNVGKGTEGEEFVQNLADWTGAHVYANSTNTGPSPKDNPDEQDWELDVDKTPADPDSMTLSSVTAKMKSLLKESSSAWLAFLGKCPINLIVVESETGNTTSVNHDGSIVEGIPNSSGSFMGETKVIAVPQNKNNNTYTMKVEGVDAGTANIEIIQPNESSIIETVGYNDVPVSEGSVITVTVSQAQSDYTMSLDNDGDGTTDASKAPDFQETLDTTTPISISDLKYFIQSDLVVLNWTAPTDNGTTTLYEVRYATCTITDNNWDSAIIAGTMTPKPAGSNETFTVTNLQPNTIYYFAVKTKDDAGLWSGLSNIVSVTTTLTSQVGKIIYVSITGDDNNSGTS